MRPLIGGMIDSRFCGSTVPVAEMVSRTEPYSARVSL